MTYTFNRRRGVQGCFVVAMLAFAMGFISLGAIFPVRPVGIFAIVFGLIVASLAAVLATTLFTRGPILTISAEGVCFTPFSIATVPWRNITSITMSQGHYSNGGGITKPDGKFGFRFSVADPSAYPKGNGLAVVNRALMTVNNTVPLSTLLINAKWQDLLVALKAHYPGKITEIPVPGFPLSNP